MSFEYGVLHRIADQWENGERFGLQGEDGELCVDLVNLH